MRTAGEAAAQHCRVILTRRCGSVTVDAGAYPPETNFCMAWVAEEFRCPGCGVIESVEVKAIWPPKQYLFLHRGRV
jgi:hypothetical protein